MIDALRPFVARGIPVVGLEPSCLLTLRDELRIEGLTMIAQNKQPRLVERTLVAAGEKCDNVINIRRAA